MGKVGAGSARSKAARTETNPRGLWNYIRKGPRKKEYNVLQQEKGGVKAYVPKKERGKYTVQRGPTDATAKGQHKTLTTAAQN